MYLNKWMLDFNLDEDVPTVILLWVKFPSFPLSCWNDDCLRAIGNGVGCYIYKEEPKGFQFTCEKIYVEVDLEKGLPT